MSSFMWDPETSLALLTYIHEGVMLGWRNKSGGIGKKTVETRIIPRLLQEKGKTITYKHYASRWKWYKTQYNKFSVLKKHSSGFGWNSTTKLFYAEEEIWTDFFKSHPDCRSLRTETIDGWDMIEEVVGMVTASGTDMAGISASGTDYVSHTGTDEREDGTNIDDDEEPIEETQLGFDDTGLDTELGNASGGVPSRAGHGLQGNHPRNRVQSNNPPHTSTNSTRKRRREYASTPTDASNAGEIAGVSQQLGGLETRLDTLTTAVLSRNQNMAWVVADPWDAIIEIPGLDAPTRFKVLALLKEKGVERSFIKMTLEHRVAWISVHIPYCPDMSHIEREE